MQRQARLRRLVAGLVAGTGAGLILQQPVWRVRRVACRPSSSTTPLQPPTTTGHRHRHTDDQRPDRDARLREGCRALVDDGTLTSAQLDAVVAALDRGGRCTRHAGVALASTAVLVTTGVVARGFVTAGGPAVGLTADELRHRASKPDRPSPQSPRPMASDVQTGDRRDGGRCEARLTERVTGGDLDAGLKADARLAG